MNSRRFCTNDPQSWSHLWAWLCIWSFLLGTCEVIHIFASIIMLKILGATVQNLVARANRRRGFYTPALLWPCYSYVAVVVVVRSQMWYRFSRVWIISWCTLRQCKLVFCHGDVPYITFIFLFFLIGNNVYLIKPHSIHRRFPIYTLCASMRVVKLLTENCGRKTRYCIHVKKCALIMCSV